VFVKDVTSHHLAYADREMTAAREKEAIARAVAALIPSGQALILDGGTTCFRVAKALAGRRLNVITNSVPIASLLSADMATEVTVLGGYVYPRTGVALGSMAERMMESLHATQMVLSCAGVTAAAAFNANQMMVDIERKMMAAADEVILAVDHTKFGMRSVVKLCELGEFDVIVTDAGTEADARVWLGKTGAKVIFAD
jgi:DeoR/GlpR family transcriptional regulator of sugar metabolism